MSAPGPGGEGGGGSGWEGWEKDEGRRALEVYHENVLFEDADDDTDADTITGTQPPVTQRKFRGGRSGSGDDLGAGSVKTHATYPLRHLLNKNWLYGCATFSAVLAAATGSVFLVQWTQGRGGLGKVITSSLMELEDTIVLPDAYDHFGDLTESYHGIKDPSMPILWNIQGNGNVVETVLSRCMKITAAGTLPPDQHDEPLKKVTTDKGTFINVYLGNPAGIQRATQQKLVKKKAVDVSITPLIYEVGKMLNEKNKGKCLAMFHHPIQRLASVHNVVRSVDPNLSDTTLLEFLETPQGRYHNNWVTRELSGGMVGKLDESHFEKARAILRQKCLVGISTETHESLSRISEYFGWKPEDEDAYNSCVTGVLNEDRIDQLRFDFVEENSPEWNVIKDMNTWDLRLFDFLNMLFQEQPYDLGWEQKPE